MWWDHGIGWGGWLAMTAGMATFWTVLVVVIITLLRGPADRATPPADARELLRERLVRGEIDVEEFDQRLEAITRTDR